MTFYYKNSFFKDIKNKNDIIILAMLNQIIDIHEKAIGFITKEKLLKYYDVNKTDITDKSILVEYVYDISFDYKENIIFSLTF